MSLSERILDVLVATNQEMTPGQIVVHPAVKRWWRHPSIDTILLALGALERAGLVNSRVGNAVVAEEMTAPHHRRLYWAVTPAVRQRRRLDSPARHTPAVREARETWVPVPFPVYVPTVPSLQTHAVEDKPFEAGGGTFGGAGASESWDSGPTDSGDGGDGGGGGGGNSA